MLCLDSHCIHDVSIVSCALCLLCPTPESAVSSGVWCGEHLEVVHGLSLLASSVAELNRTEEFLLPQRTLYSLAVAPPFTLPSAHSD